MKKLSECKKEFDDCSQSLMSHEEIKSFWCQAINEILEEVVGENHCKEKENQKLRDKIKKMTCSYFEHINSLQRKIIEIEKWYQDNSTAPENVVAWRELADILRK